MSSSGTARMIGPSSAATRCSPTKNELSPYIRWYALLRGDALVPVDAVLGEVEVLDRPLLALPQLVELRVAEEVRLAAVRRLLERGIARGAEVDAFGCGANAGWSDMARRSTAPTGWPAEARARHRAQACLRSRRASPHRPQGPAAYPPIENIASRSWREKTSNATIVCVRLTPGSFTSSPVTTSASISWRGTRMIATKSHSPVTE